MLPPPPAQFQVAMAAEDAAGPPIVVGPRDLISLMASSGCGENWDRETKGEGCAKDDSTCA